MIETVDDVDYRVNYMSRMSLADWMSLKPRRRLVVLA